MAAEYSGILSLAQTALAVNMAYIALDRFRYRSKIQQKFKDAESQSANMPKEYLDDLAWHNVQSIAAADSVKSWTEGRMGYWCYWPIHRSIDRAASYIFATLAAGVILWRAWADVMGANVTAYFGEATLDWVVVAVLALGVMSPVLCVLGGRYAVVCAERSIEDNMRHLRRRVREAAQEDVDAKLQKLLE
jgi:hypothetical protein